ncbi:MAG: hypothetical protein HY443_02010 [Candidatus Nealsonbacteria bacterium]|nr:hypothetical protein [Candidatus Nealsonbacteria bacterium]
MRKLIPILAVVILLTVLNFWRGFARKSEPAPLPEENFLTSAKQVEIEWGTIKDEALDDLDLFPSLPDLGAEAGRDNPFEPY